MVSREIERYIKKLGAFPYYKTDLKDELGLEKPLIVDYVFFHPQKVVDIAIDVRKKRYVSKQKVKTLEKNHYRYFQLLESDIKQGKYKKLF